MLKSQYSNWLAFTWFVCEFSSGNHIRAGNQLFLGINDKIRKYRLTPNCLKLYAWIAVQSARENYLLHSTGAENGNTYGCILNTVEWKNVYVPSKRRDVSNSWTRRTGAFILENIICIRRLAKTLGSLEMRISNAFRILTGIRGRSCVGRRRSVHVRFII